MAAIDDVQFSNNASTTLSGTHNNTTTTITVANGSAFPAVTSPEIAYATIQDSSGDYEIVKITAHTAAATTMTVERGADNSTAAAWANGDLIEMRLNAATLESIRDHDHDTDYGQLAAANTWTNTNDFTGSFRINGTALTATMAEINVLDADTAATTPVVAGTDSIIMDSSGTAKVDIDNVDTYLAQTNKTLTNKTLEDPVINDANGVEVLDFAATASAANAVRITNNTTGNAAKIDVTETNSSLEIAGNGTGGVITPLSLLDSNGNEWITHVATGSAVNNLRVTSGTTGNAAVVDCTETNGDLELTRNGTGDITVDSTPIYGMVILDTPIEVDSDTSTSSMASAAVDITAHTTGVAQKAIVRFVSSFTASSAISVDLRCYHPDETPSDVHNLVDFGFSTQQNVIATGVECVVNLGTGEIFEWETNFSSALLGHSTKVYLVGYYI